MVVSPTPEGLMRTAKSPGSVSSQVMSDCFTTLVFDEVKVRVLPVGALNHTPSVAAGSVGSSITPETYDVLPLPLTIERRGQVVPRYTACLVLASNEQDTIFREPAISDRVV